MRFQEGEWRDQFQTEASASPIWKSTDKYHFGLGPLHLFSSSFQNPEIFMKAPNGFYKDLCSAANFGFRGGRWRSGNSRRKRERGKQQGDLWLEWFSWKTILGPPSQKGLQKIALHWQVRQMRFKEIETYLKVSLFSDVLKFLTLRNFGVLLAILSLPIFSLVYSSVRFDRFPHVPDILKYYLKSLKLGYLRLGLCVILLIMPKDIVCQIPYQFGDSRCQNSVL